MIAPETWAMPLVMTVMSSERVISGRKGRMVSGASVCPMKMLAATFNDSAPLAPINFVMVENREKCSDKNDNWQYLEGKHETEMRSALAEVAEDELRSSKRVAEQ